MKKLTRKQAVKKLDHIFSWYIRIKNSVNGDATCVTCGKTTPWGQMQNGHFYTRGRYPTRWNEMNCHVQCPACNVFLKGNYIVYTKYMIDRYGRAAVDDLEVLSLSGSKIPTVKLLEDIDFYTKEVDRMLAEGTTPSVSPLDNTEWGML